MRMLGIWRIARDRWKGLAAVGESWIAGDSLDAERWLVEWEGELCGPGISCDGRCVALSQLFAGVSDVDVGLTWRLGDSMQDLKCGMSRFSFEDGNGPRCWIGDWREINLTTVLCPVSYPLAASFEASRQAGIVIHLVSLFHCSPTKCDQLHVHPRLSSSPTPHTRDGSLLFARVTEMPEPPAPGPDL